MNNSTTDQLPMSFEEAVLLLRGQPDKHQLLYDSFLDEDLVGGAERFRASEEFEEVLKLVGSSVNGGIVVDVGAGTGIAAFAFAKSGAQRVFAVEPDPSDVVGAGAIRRLTQDLAVEVIEACGESIELPDGVADVVYARQVLHHVRDLGRFMSECARLLKPGGVFVAAREHVVTDADQLDEFLAGHAVHELTRSEGAFELASYLGAIHDADLTVTSVFGPMDSVINTYPSFSRVELVGLPEQRWRQKLGGFGGIVAALPPAREWMRRRVVRSPEQAPGRLYTFVAVKPEGHR